MPYHSISASQIDMLRGAAGSLSPICYRYFFPFCRKQMGTTDFCIVCHSETRFRIPTDRLPAYSKGGDCVIAQVYVQETLLGNHACLYPFVEQLRPNLKKLSMAARYKASSVGSEEETGEDVRILSCTRAL